MLAVPLILYMYELEPKPPTHEILKNKETQLAKGLIIYIQENKLNTLLYPTATKFGYIRSFSNPCLLQFL
jgi:hypothetical protein